MAVVKIGVVYEPSDSDLEAVRRKAAESLEAGAIKSLPEVNSYPSKVPFKWVIEIITNDEDWPFWFGFYQGRDFSVNHRHSY